MSKRDEVGAVTAEAAVVIPVLVMVAVSLCWFVSLAVAQVRTVDAARETARALARSDEQEAAVALGRQVAPEGAEFKVAFADGLVRVTVTAAVKAPGGVFTFPGFEAHASVVAATEHVP